MLWGRFAVTGTGKLQKVDKMNLFSILQHYFKPSAKRLNLVQNTDPKLISMLPVKRIKETSIRLTTGPDINSIENM